MQLSRGAFLLVGLVGLHGLTGIFGYDALHIIDLQQVVCSDTGYLDIPLNQEQITSEAHKPHIITFLRSTNKRTIITYSLVNSATPAGEWSQGPQLVTLGEVASRRLQTSGAQDAQSAFDDAEDMEEWVDEASDGRMLGARRRAPSYSSPRSRSSPPSSPRRRASTYRAPPPAATPRRRASTPAAAPRRRAVPVSSPRRRASSSGTPPAGGTPRRRATVSPRRRGAPAETGPRRRTTGYTVPGTPSYYSTAGTGGQRYGYSNQQSMSGNYGGGQPYGQPYGYSGQSSYGSSGSGGKSNAMMYGAGGLAAGALLGVGSYYMYQRMTQSRCEGYGCCYGCDDACYDGSRDRCDMKMDKQLYRDDLMIDSGFIPNDEIPWPPKVRIFSVSGEGYPKASICPPENCDNVTECGSPAEVPDLYVTLTVMEPLAHPADNQAVSGAHSMGVPFYVLLPMLLLSLRVLRRAC